ncbi:MAG: aldolase [Methanomicrobiales archaeon]|jgi:L-fuculose-phosphate aldolase|nr:aldolase [Methanomicrobiales archaeon]
MEFSRVGQRLIREGLVTGNFGNMSVRMGEESFAITRTGRFLDEPGDPVIIPIRGTVPPDASTEYRVHHAVYAATKVDAIVHAHPPHAVALSLGRDEIIPVDSEGEMFAPRIPVVGGDPGTEELARHVVGGFTAGRVIIVQGHGTFAGGSTLEEAYLLTAVAEHSCHVRWLWEVSYTGRNEVPFP